MNSCKEESNNHSNEIKNNYFLFPFRYFKPPKVNVKLFFLKLPTGNWLLILLSIIFLICCSGYFFVPLTNSPIKGYTLTEDRDLVISKFDLERYESQFGAETYYVMIIYSIIFFSLLSLYFVIANPPKNNILYGFIAFCGFLFPFSLFLLIPLLQQKDFNYFPGFLMNLKHKIPQF